MGFVFRKDRNLNKAFGGFGPPSFSQGRVQRFRCELVPEIWEDLP